MAHFVLSLAKTDQESLLGLVLTMCKVNDDDFRPEDRPNWLWVAGVRGGWLELSDDSLTLREGQQSPGKGF